MTTLVQFAEYTQSVVIDYFMRRDDLNKDSWIVLYGDQDKLPRMITACVEPNVKSTELRNAFRGVRRTLEVFVLVYFGSLNQSGQINRLDADKIAEEIEAELNKNPQGDGSLVHCMVSEIASGYSSKDGTIVKSSRITFQGDSTDQLPG